MITYSLRTAAVVTLVYIYRSDVMITYKLNAAGAMISVYTLQIRCHDHIQTERSRSDDISVHFTDQMA